MASHTKLSKTLLTVHRSHETKPPNCHEDPSVCILFSRGKLGFLIHTARDTCDETLADTHEGNRRPGISECT